MGRVETTLGRGIHLRAEMTPSLAPSKHRKHLSPSLHSAVAEGGGTFEESTFHFTPSSLAGRRSSALIPPQVYVGETHNMSKEKPAAGRPIFQVRAATQSQCPPWRI
ncbi:unnamed protein product [Pleuronectes platessa]|uniref:Uncharacterized protein n=1 Tax=Pleuronectes platessa TaxID=8262 RepID=A0A9N7V9Z3_PLEPL|nr:unnamed protein product [Pleuronectes platessa]